MILLELEKTHHNHKLELEQRLRIAEDNLKNLDRMANECFKSIDKFLQEDIDKFTYRANEAKENFSFIFMALTKSEEKTINEIRLELGVEKLLPQHNELDLYETDGSDLSEFHTKQQIADKIHKLKTDKKARGNRDATL